MAKPVKYTILSLLLGLLLSGCRVDVNINTGQNASQKAVYTSEASHSPEDVKARGVLRIGSTGTYHIEKKPI